MLDVRCSIVSFIDQNGRSAARRCSYETTSLCRKIKGAPIVLVLDKILIPEDEHENEDEYEYEKYQIRSPESALSGGGG
jgi:hypothetical protein